jgi:branched-chain amino acid transport system permease protein
MAELSSPEPANTAVAPRAHAPFRSPRIYVVIVLALVVCGIPFLPIANDYVISVVVRALLFIMLGQAWNVIAGFGGLMSLGHGIFFGTSAYLTILLFNHLGISPWIGAWAGVVVSIGLALLIGIITLRSRGIYFALATIVITLAFEKIARYLVGVTGGDAGLALTYLGNAPWAMQFSNPAVHLWISLAVVVIYYIFTRWLAQSPYGLRLQAVRDDEDAAAANGVDVLFVKLSGLSISAGMTALAGTLYAQFYLSIDPTTAYGLFQAIQIKLPALIGGIGTASGPVIGGAVAILLSEVTNWLDSRFHIAGMGIFVYGFALLVVVQYAPRGILGIFSRLPSHGARGEKK